MTAATGNPAPAAARITRAPRDAKEQAAANARMSALLSRPDAGPAATHLALVHFTGRRSKRPYTVPAGVHRLDGALYLATSSSWRHNFTDATDAELTRADQPWPYNPATCVDFGGSACRVSLPPEPAWPGPS